MDGQSVVLFNLTDSLPIMFGFDEVSLIFGITSVLIWASCGLILFHERYFRKSRRTF